jgi:hypothetical protein
MRLGTALLVVTLAMPAVVTAQPPATTEAEREQAYINELRREDPSVADRYVELRAARAQALGELRRVETQYNGAGPELRGLFARSLVQARKKYAETSLALLDFYDARDHGVITKYQEAIGRINSVLEDRKRTRAELQKLLAP